MENVNAKKPRGWSRLPPAVRHLLKFLLGGAALWALVHTGALDPRLIGRAFVNHPLICAAGFAAYVGLVLMAAWLRWYLLLLQAGLDVSPWRCLRLHMVGIFFNSLLPGGTGGDLMKGFYLFKEHGEGDRSLALTSIAMDRFIGLYGLLCTAMIMTWANVDLWIHNSALRFNCFFYAAVFIAFTGMIVFFFSPYSKFFLEHPSLHKLPGGRMMKSFSDSLLVYRKKPRLLLLPLALGVVVDMGLILLYFLFANSLELHLPFLTHGFVVPTLTMINGIPISPAGLGVGEAAGEKIYHSLGVTDGGGELLALVHICILATSLIGAPFYFLYRVQSRNGESGV